MTMQLNLDISSCMEKAELNVVKQENIGSTEISSGKQSDPGHF